MAITVRLIGSLSLVASICACAPAMGPLPTGGRRVGGGRAARRRLGDDLRGVPADILRTCSLANVCSFGPVVGAPFDRCVESLVRDRLEGGRLRGGEAPASRPAGALRYEVVDVRGVHQLRAHEHRGVHGDGRPVRGPGRGVLLAAHRQRAQVTDCAALGLTCDAGRCVGPAGAPACTSTSDAPLRCDGAALVRCAGPAGGMGTEVREPCPAGSACQAAGRSFRRPLRPRSCTTPGVRCEGTTLVAPAARDRHHRAAPGVRVRHGVRHGHRRVARPAVRPRGDRVHRAPDDDLHAEQRALRRGRHRCVRALGRTTRVRCADLGAPRAAWSRRFRSACSAARVDAVQARRTRVAETNPRPLSSRAR